SEAWAADTWAAIEALTKVMRKAGYPKPRKAPQKAADASDGSKSPPWIVSATSLIRLAADLAEYWRLRFSAAC
ncbi:hypothetical protein, partial [Aeromonas caviae]|uniref:hypothetical protein n=1 Tax=Aeromonas caviae TaxID=648 RepID=UPI001CC3E4DC